MGFSIKRFAKNAISNPLTLANPMSGFGVAAAFGNEKNLSAQEELDARNRGINSERLSLLEEGLKRGRDKAEALTGQTEAQTGADVKDIIARRRQAMDQPSRAESAIRAQGQNTARRAVASGASDAQQRQIELESAQRAGIQGDVDRERRLQDFQSLMGNVMSMQSSLEPGYGQLMLASQYIAPEQQRQGLLGDLFQGLGL